ncbi:hypothetical protein [Kordiimonas sediminis]|uniref:hypothetical protein n=1 Tax=Kordiimonas sediminis TaxID=1735581 RepID=UPI00174977F3|nr:hypothetical protein [Kordiimonas sediminis]
MDEKCDKDQAPKPTVIEASWAPPDPRDLTSNENASGPEKAWSMVRIFGAYHPILNLPIIIFDAMMGRSGTSGRILVSLIVVSLIFTIFFFA